MRDAKTESGGPGRPRSEAAREAVLRAAWTLLAERPLGTITVAEIARRSRVSKPTIYKWWPTKAALAVEAFFAFTALETPFPQAKSAALRLRRQLESLVAFYGGKAGEIVADIVSQGRTDPDTLEYFREHYLALRRGEARGILEEGIRNGEFAEDLDPEVALDMLYGPVYYRLLFAHAPLDKRFARKLADRALEAFRQRP